MSIASSFSLCFYSDSKLSFANAVIINTFPYLWLMNFKFNSLVSKSSTTYCKYYFSLDITIHESRTSLFTSFLTWFVIVKNLFFFIFLQMLLKLPIKLLFIYWPLFVLNFNLCELNDNHVFTSLLLLRNSMLELLSVWIPSTL